VKQSCLSFFLALGLSLGATWAQEPAAAEAELFGRAQKSGLAQDYRAYLDAYPEGTFAEIAAFELKWGNPGEAAGAPQTTIADAPRRQTGITFTTPLVSAPEGHSGASIADLIKGSPLFPPIEGIPEQLWKGQTCTNCHQWTKENLCDQGKTYLTPAGSTSLVKPHPYGGAFKAAVRTFAEEGCK
jgi:hypothetical protein